MNVLIVFLTETNSTKGGKKKDSPAVRLGLDGQGGCRMLFLMCGEWIGCEDEKKEENFPKKRGHAYASPL